MTDRAAEDDQHEDNALANAYARLRDASEALAAVTAERDHARESSDRYSTALGELREQAVMNETRLRKELEQARQMLADGPHDANTCATCWGPQPAVCTCWKAGL